MRIIRHTLNNRIKGAVLIVLSILLVGLIPIRTVYAASAEVSIPYRQTWTNRSGEAVDDSFEYRLTAVDGAPLPDEANGEFYRFELKGNVSGSIKLHFPFSKPGYYNYLVRAYIPDRKSDYSYDEKAYDVMIMVVNADNGLEVGAMTIQDESLAKYAELPFSMAYTKEPVDPGGTTPAAAPTNPAPGDGAAPGGGGGGGAGAPGAGPAGPAGTVITDPTPPTTAIDDPEPPKNLFPTPDNWALLNLILMVLSVILALADALLYFKNPTDKYGDEYEYEEDEEEDVKRHGLPRLLALLAAIISVIVFFITEDITQPMIWVDEYTIWMLLLFIATALLTMMSKKDQEDQDDDSMEAAT